MLDLQATIEAAVKASPENEDFIREHLPRYVSQVETRQIHPGDFFFMNCGPLWVQRIHFEDDGLDEVEVFIRATELLDIDDDV